ncbi:MAG: hypothetical protein ACXWXT_14210, partial [Candidatus Binatia bacterium]
LWKPQQFCPRSKLQGILDSSIRPVLHPLRKVRPQHVLRQQAIDDTVAKLASFNPPTRVYWVKFASGPATVVREVSH